MITYCQMTMNRLLETKDCVEKYLPYVDKVIIVDGGSIDDTIFYMRNWAEREPKLEFYIHQWKDQFSEQRNNYLQYVQDNTWCLVSDPDEFFTEKTLKKLKNGIDIAEKNNYEMLGFRCRSVTTKGPDRVHESLDNYWKGLLFKKTSDTKYIGQPHETLLKSEKLRQTYTLIKTDLIYEHIKQENIIWHRGARNLFCGGGGPNLGVKNLRWVNLKNICLDIGIHSWHQFDSYLIKGEIDGRIKDWFIEVHDLDGFDGASEHREMYKLYFRIYHPDQEPEELKNKQIP